MNKIRLLVLGILLCLMILSITTMAPTKVYAQECTPTNQNCTLHRCVFCTASWKMKQCAYGKIWNCYTYTECRVYPGWYQCEACGNCPN